MPIVAGARLEHYEIISLLGAGGMGEVWRARDTRLGRDVAIKLLPAEFAKDADRLRRFEQEARATSTLNHPNVLTIYDIGSHDSSPFIVAELLEGEVLRAQLNGGPLPTRKAVEYAQQIAAGLNSAHEKGVVHRDLKPENLFVTTDGRVKILDFGLAKLKPPQVGAADSQAPTQRKITDPGTVMGTVGYMSPEQARGQKVDARTDVFSLGVVLYEMLAGCAPFDGVSAIEVMGAILHQEPAPLRQRVADAPRELEHVVSKALRKDREQRYQMMKDLLIDLQDLKEELAFSAKLECAGQTVRNEAVTAPADAAPTTAGTAAQTISSAKIILGEIKRHKLAAYFALLLMIAAAVGIGFYLHAQKTDSAIDSIAVLPFTNQNHAEETDYLADGLTESIINNLTQLPDLRVIARNSAFRYKGKEDDPLSAGKTLGVRAVVVGRLLQRGEQLMVSAELVDVRENKQLWGQQYIRRLADVFAVQEEIAKEISERLRLKLTSTEQKQLAKRPTENLKAFQYYMQGRLYTQRRSREGLLKAIRYDEKALAPLGAYGYIAPIEGRRKAEEAARKAFELDENLAEAHVALGQLHVVFAPYSFTLGDRELRRAIELSPSLALAHFYLGISLVRQGRLDESLAELLKARELDPLASNIAHNATIPYYFKRDYARALELLRQANELSPAFSATWEIGVCVQNRLFNETPAELEKAKQERKDDSILIYSTGMGYAARGKRAEALRVCAAAHSSVQGEHREVVRDAEPASARVFSQGSPFGSDADPDPRRDRNVGSFPPATLVEVVLTPFCQSAAPSPPGFTFGKSRFKLSPRRVKTLQSAIPLTGRKMPEISPAVEVEARFNSIIEEYGKILRQTIVHFCPKDLGLQFTDIEQEAQLRLWRALLSEREIHDLASYLYRIAETTTLEAIRRVKTKREEQLRLAEEAEEEERGELLHLIADSRGSPECQAQRQELVSKLKAALARLPDNRRAAVELRLQEMTSQEIAHLTGWTEPKARNLVYRGLKDLREHLRAEGVEYEID